MTTTQAGVAAGRAASEMKSTLARDARVAGVGERRWKRAPVRQRVPATPVSVDGAEARRQILPLLRPARLLEAAHAELALDELRLDHEDERLATAAWESSHIKRLINVLLISYGVSTLPLLPPAWPSTDHDTSGPSRSVPRVI